VPAGRWARAAAAWLRLLAGGGAAALAAGVALADPPTAKSVSAYAPCDTCHDDITASFAANPHARLAAATCASCHGDGSKHAAADGDKALIKVPTGPSGAKLCLGCHGGGAAFTRTGTGAHATASVYCASCHSIHSPAPANAALLRAERGAECVSCHPAQRREFDKPFAHHLGRSGLACYSCHNPHGGTGRASLKTGTAGELPCLTCHGEKRGPFVFQHVSGMTGDCMSCHEPHGSNNPKRLTRARVDQVCLECHSALPAGNLGAGPPSFHNLLLPRYQNCTVCHVAIHGSNSSPMLLK